MIFTVKQGKEINMSFTAKNAICLIISILLGIVLGRLFLRFIGVMLLGGTMFGGDFL